MTHIYTPMPIIVPMRSHNYTHTSGEMHFIPEYSGKRINIAASTECGTYKSGGEWWIWFNINGNSKYYAYSFKDRISAEEELDKILNIKKEKNE